MAHALLLAAAPHLSARWRRRYVERLIDWFATHQRDLPWRRTEDPYAIWLSESMLQQTQVATVIDYYHRFLARFPDVRSLAEADEEAVLAQWAGLGYYRRARQLHAAAQEVVSRHDAVFPSDVAELMNLPGIGRYTAGAVASIAFDKPAPIVEANTERLYARLLCLKEPTRSPAGQTLLWQFADWQLSRSAAGGARLVNQAAMELGSLVCKPLKPLCHECPLLGQCPTAQQGLQASIPAPKPKKEITSLHHVALAIARGQRWLVRINPQGAWWAGLWDFPRVDITTLKLGTAMASHLAIDPSTCASIEAAAAAQLGLKTQVQSRLFRLSHGVTRYRIQLDCIEAVGADISDSASSKPSGGKPIRVRAQQHGRPRAGAPAGWLWSTPSELAQLPLTSPARKILQRLSKLPS